MEELDLKELFNIFWNKRMDIILIVITCVILGALYSFIWITPKYTSYTKMVLTQSGNIEGMDNNASITQTDLNVNSKLVATYSDLIKSKSILREVINNLGNSELTEEGIRKCISVKAVTGTEVIRIDVTHENAKYACDIANEIAKVFSEKIVDIYNISNVYIVDKAEVSTAPSNINHIKDLVIFAFVGVVVAAAYVLILNMLDNTIKTEEDVEKTTGLLVLASIFDYEMEGSKGGRRK